jgi:hypothetical protein|nr:phage holin family protein [Thermoflavimicrobium daqui]
MENVAKAGVPIPTQVKGALKVLQDKGQVNKKEKAEQE